MRISRSSKPDIIITMGDPAGIGPEVALKALASPKVKGLANFLLIGDGTVLSRTAAGMRIADFPHVLDMANVPKGLAQGRASAAAGRAAIRYIDMALELIAAGEADRLVTAPVNKASIRAAGIRGFQGHTEYIASRFGVKKFAMMFVGKDLKVTLVTRHMPLAEVPSSLTVDAIYNTIMLTHEYLKRCFRVKDPGIAVLGLNPHAGEDGAFGDEESRLIVPAMKRSRKTVKNLFGPVPADVAFHHALAGKYDAVVAMYHDQALAPFKTLYFDSGVNLTLGLPFVRTSPDHGTAFDIAGKSIADPASMIEAIRLACSISKCSRKPN